MSVSLGVANVLGLLIIVAGIVGLVMAGRRYANKKNATRNEDRN